MMNSRTVLRSGLGQLVSYITTLFVGLLLLPYLVSKLGGYEYGLWALVTGILGNFTLLQLGLASSVQNLLAIESGKHNTEGFNRIFSNGVFVFFSIGAGLFLIITSFCLIELSFNSLNISQKLTSVVFILGANLAISFAIFPYTSVLGSQLRFDFIAAATLLQSILNATLTLISLSLGYGILALACSYLVSGIFGNFLTYVWAKAAFPDLCFRKVYIERNIIIRLAKYSGKSFMTQLGDLLRFRIDELVIGSFVGIEPVAYYSIANRMVTAANGPTVSIMGLLNSLFAQYHGMNDINTLKRSLQFTMKLYGSISAFTLAVIVIFGRWFIEKWFGPSYQVAYLPAVILGVGYFVARIQSPVISIFYAIDRHEYFAYMNLFEGVMNLILSVMFVWKLHMGITGVALGTLIPILVTKLLIQPFWAPRFINMPIKQYIGIIGKVMLTTIFLYGPYYLIVMQNGVFSSYRYLAIIVISLLICLLLQLLLLLDQSERSILIVSMKRQINPLGAIIIAEDVIE